MAERVLIVGGDAAGMSAASRIRRLDPSIRVSVLEREQVVSYAACGMPYHLDGRIARPESLLIRSPAQFESMGIEVLTGHEATEVDISAASVRAWLAAERSHRTLRYDHLLLATGASAVRPWLDGVDAENVFLFRRYEDLLDLSSYLDRRLCRRVTVVGGGYIGVELAEVLTLRGMSVTIVEAAPTLLPRTLDPEMASLVEDELHRNGVSLHLASPIEGFIAEGGIASHVSTSEGVWSCDVVILALGVRPNSALAKAAGIALDEFDAVATDAHLRSAIEGVWAAGDCTSTVSRITGKRIWVPLGPAANKQGRIAGANMVGQRLAFPGVVGTAFVKAFALQVGSTGLSETEARLSGMNVTTSTITAGDRAPYYPGGQDTCVKLVADASTGRLLGGQVVGRSGVPGRTNVVATALHAEMDIQAFAELDLGYAPPFSPVWDPLLVAANQLQRA